MTQDLLCLSPRGDGDDKLGLLLTVITLRAGM